MFSDQDWEKLKAASEVPDTDVVIGRCPKCGATYSLFRDGSIGPHGTIPLSKLDAGDATLDDVTFDPICEHIKTLYGIREN